MKCITYLEGDIYMTHALRFMGVNRDTETAGPGKRLEFFTKGCIRGVIAPCQGCFNESTWTFAGQFREMEVKEIVDICAETAWNRQVTFCGGEPILQAKALAEVAKQLKEMDPTFHFVMYTAYKLDTLMKYGLKFTWTSKYEKAMGSHLYNYATTLEHLDNDRVQFTILTPEDVKEVMKYIDIIVDGDYQMDKRLTTDKYMHPGWFVGSSNQRVIDAPESIKNDKLTYVYADEYNEKRLSSNHCRSCGHDIKSSHVFCNERCAEQYNTHKKEHDKLRGL